MTQAIDTRSVPSLITKHLKKHRNRINYIRKVLFLCIYVLIMNMFNVNECLYVCILFVLRRQRWRRQEGK